MTTCCPGVRQSAAPAARSHLVRPRPARGKSTLVNSVVGTQVSLTGVRRAYHQLPGARVPIPNDIHWVRGEHVPADAAPGAPGGTGQARARRAARALPRARDDQGDRPCSTNPRHRLRGCARHYDFAYQFLDASDLWLFMTKREPLTRTAPVWELLTARPGKRGRAALGVVPVQGPAEPSHPNSSRTSNAMLDRQRDTGGPPVSSIPETGIVDGLPARRTSSSRSGTG